MQPLWYNWCFEFVDWQHGSCFKPGDPSNALPPLSILRDFYRQQIIERKLGFPDGYILLSSNETELKQRKENDSSRRRSGFAKNLLIIEPQKRYFQAINNLVPRFVQAIAATSIETNIKTIKALPAFPKLPEHPYSLTIFDLLIEWLSRNKPY